MSPRRTRIVFPILEILEILEIGRRQSRWISIHDSRIPLPLLLLLPTWNRKCPVFSQDTLLFLFPNLRSKESRYSKYLELETRTSERRIRIICEKTGRQFFLSRRDSESSIKREKRHFPREGLSTRRSSGSSLRDSSNLSHYSTDFATNSIMNFEITPKIIRVSLASRMQISSNVSRKVFGEQFLKVFLIYTLLLWIYSLKIFRACGTRCRGFPDPAFSLEILRPSFPFLRLILHLREKCLNQGLTSLYFQRMLVEIISLAY